MDPKHAPVQSDVTARLRDLKKERDVLDALNTQLRANQADLKAALAAGKQREQEQAAQLVDLQEQVRTLSIGSAIDREHGTATHWLLDAACSEQHRRYRVCLRHCCCAGCIKQPTECYLSG